MTETCRECGGNSFCFLEGQQICEECQVVVVGYTETLSQEEVCLVDRSRLISAGRMMQDGVSNHEGSGDKGNEQELNNWTSYEMYNIVLHGWTKAMCQLGASDMFRRTVFKLWAAYLHRLEVAFFETKATSTKIPTPRVSFMTHRRDVMLLNMGKTSVTSKDLSPRFRKQVHKGKAAAKSELEKIKRKVERKKLQYEMKTGKKRETLSHAVACELSRSLTDFENSSVFISEDEQEEPDQTSQWGGQSSTVAGLSLKSFNTEGDQEDGDQSSAWGGLSSVTGYQSMADQSSVWEGQSSITADQSMADQASLKEGHSPQVEEEKTNEPKASSSEPGKEYPVPPTTRLCRNAFVRKWLESQKQIYAAIDSEIDVQNCAGENAGETRDDSTTSPSVISSGHSSFRKRKRKGSFSSHNEDPEATSSNHSPASKRRRKVIVSSHKRSIEGSVSGHKNRKDRPSSTRGSLKGYKIGRSCPTWDTKRQEVRLSKLHKSYLRERGALHLNFHRILALLYLAVLLAKEDILLMDILRWCREGHIPYLSAQYLLPPSMRLFFYDLKLLATLRQVPPASKVIAIAGNVAIFLSLREVPLPAPEDVITKLVCTLNLPESVGKLSKELCSKVDTIESSAFALPPVECQAAASIVLVLKMMYGLNDWYEDRLSWTAQAVEKELEGEHTTPRTSHHLFSWQQWQRHMNAVVRLCCVVDPVSAKHYHSLLPKTGRPLPAFIAQSYWTDSIWNVPRTTVTRKKGLQALANRVLQAQGESLEDVLRGDNMYQPSRIPLTDVLNQFLSKHCTDTDQGIKDYVKFGDELMKVSFTSHSLDWMCHLTDVQEDLKARDCMLHLTPSKVHKDAYVDGSTQLFTSCQEEPAFMNPCTKKKQQGTEAEHFVPHPPEASWKLSTAIVRSWDSSAWSKFPASFRWLVKLMSLVCETSRWHIVWMARKMEKITIPDDPRRKKILTQQEAPV